MLPSFTKNPVPVIKEVDQKKVWTRWHSVGMFHHIGGENLNKSQEVFKKGLSQFNRAIPLCALREVQYTPVIAAHTVFRVIRLSDQHADSLLGRLQSLGMLGGGILIH